MIPEAEDLLKKALALPDKERAELAGSLLDSLDTALDEDADALWQEEITRRLEEIRCGKVTSVPWSEVHAKGRTILDGA